MPGSNYEEIDNHVGFLALYQPKNQKKPGVCENANGVELSSQFEV